MRLLVNTFQKTLNTVFTRKTKKFGENSVLIVIWEIILVDLTKVDKKFFGNPAPSSKIYDLSLSKTNFDF